MRPSPGTWMGLATALAVSMAALVAAAGARPDATERATAPFGWSRVIVVHALATLPLAAVAAVAMGAAAPFFRTRWAAALGAAVGLAVASVSLLAGGGVGHALDVYQVGWLGRLITRVAWCFALQAPWCLAGAALDGGRRPLLVVRHTLGVRLGAPGCLSASAGHTGRQAARATRQTKCGGLLATRRLAHPALWAAAVSVLVPAAYVDSLAARQTVLARAHWQALQIDRAEQVVSRLCEVGSARSLGQSDQAEGGDISPRKARDMLRANLELLRRQVAALRFSSPDEPSQVLLAECLASQGRENEAIDMLAPLAARRPDAAARLGLVLQWRRDWPESSRWFRQVLDLAETATPDGPAERETLLRLRRQAYNALARNAREMSAFDQAAACYLEAIERLPSEAAHFHAELARHYDLAGRPLAAIEHQRRAFELDPARFPQPLDPVSKILSSSTPVGLFAPAASNRR